jgi:hypothetical protein
MRVQEAARELYETIVESDKTISRYQISMGNLHHVDVSLLDSGRYPWDMLPEPWRKLDFPGIVA